jgi:hypothetical protein
MPFQRSQLPGRVPVPAASKEEQEFMAWLTGQATHRGEFGPEEFRDKPGLVEQETIIQRFLGGEWQTVKSSVHAAAHYNGQERTLDVNFRAGGGITVHDYSEAEAIAYITAPSHGVYMWDHWLVRGRGNQGKTRKKITKR